MQLNPYVTFNGNCEAALGFYARVLGGKITMLTRHGEAPAEYRLPAEHQHLVMHARLQLGERTLMASDAPPEYQRPYGGFSLQLEISSPQEAERVFAALAEGGNISMPMTSTFWAQRFGMLTDQFGIAWIINCETPAAA